MPIRPENRRRSCAWCLSTFEAYLGRKDVRWCSMLCKKRAASAEPRSASKSCKHCGCLFAPPKSAKQAYCSRRCKTLRERAVIAADPKRVAQRRVRQRAYTTTTAYRIAQRSAKARRRTTERTGSVTVKQWALICAAYGDCCAYCRTKAPLTMDHVVAIANGGAHEPSNVVPACKPCNSSKGTADWSAKLVSVPCP